MIRRIRRIAFLILFALFLAVAPAMVMYCLGWRFDWNQRRVIEPGMLYLKAAPKSAEVYVEGKLQKKTDIFFGSLLVEKLMPKTYEIEIRKAGYHPWKKNLTVDKRQVTEAKNIVLIPENPSLSKISENIEEIFLAPDNRKIILKEIIKTEKETQTSKWSLKTIDVSSNLKSHLITQDDLKIEIPAPRNKETPAEIELVNIKFSENSKKALLQVKLKEKSFHYILDIQTAKLTPLIFKTEPKEIFFNPNNEEKLYLLVLPEKTIKDGKTFLDIKEANIETGEISAPLLNNVVSLDILNKDIYLLDDSGFIFKSNLSFMNMEKLNIVPVEIKNTIEYELTVINENIFLKQNDALYVFNKYTMIFQKILDTVNGFVLSPDSKQLLYFNDSEMWLTFLEDKIEQPHKERGEKVLLASFPEKIENAYWYTGSYIIFNSGNKIKISETDDRSELNIVNVFEMENPQTIWVNNKLYILSNQSLFVSTDLLP